MCSFKICSPFLFDAVNLLPFLQYPVETLIDQSSTFHDYNLQTAYTTGRKHTDLKPIKVVRHDVVLPFLDEEYWLFHKMEKSLSFSLQTGHSTTGRYDQSKGIPCFPVTLFLSLNLHTQCPSKHFLLHCSLFV